MKLLLGLIASLVVGLNLAPVSQKAPVPSLVIAGSLDGYLSPCGCTKPMSGGIRRMAEAVENLRSAGPVVLVQFGGLIKGQSRQDELKLETAMEAFRTMGAAGVQLTEFEARLGTGIVANASRLGNDPFVSSNLIDAYQLPVQEFVIRPPYVVGTASTLNKVGLGATGGTTRTITQTAQAIVAEASKRKFIAVLLLDGPKTQAEQVAREVPGLAMIAYKASSPSPGSLVRMGNTLLVSPGEKGKSLLLVSPIGRQLKSYKVITLEPKFRDQPDVQRIYQTYQRRVDQENLLEKLPRAESADYAGTQACMSCHTSAGKIWEKSRHAHALASLEKEGAGRDPDCVGCHVVALDRKSGFQSRSATPQLANVGCESCHGPAKAHALKPTVPLPKAGETSCRSCHLPTQSPGFNFAEYWKKIAHK